MLSNICGCYYCILFDLSEEGVEDKKNASWLNLGVNCLTVFGWMHEKKKRENFEF